MAIEIVVPRLGWSMEKGNFGQWLKRDGERVEQGDMLFVLEGSLTVEVDEERSVLQRGDSIHFPSSKVHSTWNHSDTPATILWVGTMDVSTNVRTGRG